VIRLVGFFIIVAAAVGAALTLNAESGRTMRFGYQLAELEGDYRELLDENRNLKVEVARLRTTTHLHERMDAFGLEIESPEEYFTREAARLAEAEAARKREGEGAPR